MQTQDQRPLDDYASQADARYERPAIIYRGKLEAFANNCGQPTSKTACTAPS